MFKIVKFKKPLKVIFFDFYKSLLTITNIFLGLIFIVFTFWIFIYTIEKAHLQDPFLETITLPKEVIDTGNSEKIFTEKIRDNVQYIINSFSKNKKNSNLEKIYERFNFNRSVCTYSNPNIAEINSQIINLLNDDQDFDIPKVGISTSDAIQLLKHTFNSQHATFKTSIIKNTEAQNYTVNFRVIYKDTDPSENEVVVVNSIPEAENEISLFLLKYSNPVIYAYLTSFNNPSEIKNLIELAVNHYSTYQNNAFVYSLIGHSILVSNRNYATNKSYREAEDILKKAFEINKDEDLANLDQITIERNLKTSPSSDYIATLSKIISNGNYVTQAYHLLYEIRAEQNKSDAIKLIKLGVERFPSNLDLKKFYVFVLAKNNENKTAMKFINEVLDSEKGNQPTNVVKISSNSYLRNLLMFLTDGNINSIYISAYSEKMNDCDFIDWSKAIFTLTESKPNRVEILEDLVDEFQLKETQGMSNFDFHTIYAFVLNTLSILKSDPKLEKESIIQSTNSLKYPGDKAMSYNNIGNLLFKNKNYAEAEINFKNSVNSKKIPLNVSNYLTTIYLQNKFKEFLHEYLKLKSVLVEDDKHYYPREYIHYGISNCKMNNKKIANNVYKESNNLQKSMIIQKKPISEDLSINLSTLHQCLAS